MRAGVFSLVVRGGGIMGGKPNPGTPADKRIKENKKPKK